MPRLTHGPQNCRRRVPRPDFSVNLHRIQKFQPATFILTSPPHHLRHVDLGFADWAQVLVKDVFGGNFNHHTRADNLVPTGSFQPIRRGGCQFFPRRSRLPRPISTSSPRWAKPANARLHISGGLATLRSPRLTIRVAFPRLVRRSLLRDRSHIPFGIGAWGCMGYARRPTKVIRPATKTQTQLGAERRYTEGPVLGQLSWCYRAGI